MTDQPERRMMRPKHSLRPGGATVAADMCPRCKGDNTEAFSLCAACVTPPALRDLYAAAIRSLRLGDDETLLDDTNVDIATDAVLAVRVRELEQLRARVRHVADLIECGAPWTASRADAAARVRDAVEPEKPAATPAVPPKHIGNGANAEDCPACSGTNLPYPWVCPGESS